MNAAEDRLSAIMDAATRALAPPIDTILAEGERLGRRRRRRRHAAIATGTAVVVLAGGVGVAAAVHLSRPTNSTDVAAAVTHTPSQAPAGGGTPSPSVTSGTGPVVTPNPKGPTAAITALAAARILRLSAGPDWRFENYLQSTSIPGSLLDADINDGMGEARVTVDIRDAIKSGMAPADCSKEKPGLAVDAKRPVGAVPPSCNVVVYPNGDLVMQEVTATDATGLYQYRIIAYRADGIAVEFTVANGDWAYKGGHFARVRPPGTVALWTSIALDRSWQFKVPVELNASPSPSSGV